MIIFSSCSFDKSSSNKSDLTGDWKIMNLTKDGEEAPGETIRSFPIISFRSDSLVFYFNTLFKFEYDSSRDSLFLTYPDSIGTGSYARKFKVNFLELNKMSLTYARKIINDTISLSTHDIFYNAIYERID